MSLPHRKTLAAVFLLAILSGCSGPVEDTRPGQPVKHRQEAFKSILRAFEPMGTMLRTDRYEAGAFAAMAEDLHAVREGPWSYFGADTLYPPSKAKAAVWERPADFEAKRAEFEAAVAVLREVAQGSDRSVLLPAYERVHNSCKSCHQDFKK